jgi:hypothetical protein
VPGTYEVTLIVDGRSYRQSLVVKLDPRVQTAPADLQSQQDLARQMVDGMESSYTSYYQISTLQLAIGERRKGISGAKDGKEISAGLTALEQELNEIQNGKDDGGVGPVNRDLARYLIMIESADAAPAASARENAAAACQSLKKDLMRWRVVNSDRLPALNKLLEANRLGALTTVLPPTDPICSQ